jgi:hypothetical protein
VISMRSVRAVIMRRSATSAGLMVSVLLTVGLSATGPALGAIGPASAGTVHASARGALATVASPTQPAAARPIRASFSAVSCKGTSWCMAVGSYTDRSHVRHALAQVWNGQKWRTLKNPPGRSLTGVSCSAPWFCMAIGGPTGMETWNGGVWRRIKSPVGRAGGVSCGSRSLCMVINGRINGGVAESWNGRQWRTWAQNTDACGGPPGFPCGLAGVSCGSASNCVAVGTQTVSQEPVQNTVAFAWDGIGWGGTSPPNDGNPAALNAISCAGKFCMTVGGAFSEVQSGGIAVAGTWDARTQSWQDVSPSLGTLCSGFGYCFWAGVISCGSATNCMTFGRGNLAWNGMAWVPAPSVSAGRGSSLGTVSCAVASCMAVGFRTIAGAVRPLAELWNGATWKILRTPVPG